MTSLHFDTSVDIRRTWRHKLLPIVGTAVALTSLVGTSCAQGTVPITITVGGTPLQTLKGIGASQTHNRTAHDRRDEMMDLTFHDLNMKVLRIWCQPGISTDSSALSSSALAADIYKNYVDNGFVDAAISKGVTTLLLGPTLPSDATLTLPAVQDYAKRIAGAIRILRTGPDPANPTIKKKVLISVTGLVNEPRDTWTSPMLVLGVKTLRSELDAAPAQAVSIVAPESATCNSDSTQPDGTGAVQRVQKLKDDGTAWDAMSGIATHSYGMAASDTMANVVAPNGVLLKDWWITEAGGVNKYGDDQAKESEPPSGPLADPKAPDPKQAAAYLAARFFNDMNHQVTHWVWFIAFSAQSYAVETDGGQTLVGPGPSPVDDGPLNIRPKYWYFKQLREAFPDGTVFRRCDSSLDSGMLWSSNKRAHVNVAAGKAPDGTWRIGMVNLTPAETDPDRGGTVRYLPTTYLMTVKINGLSDGTQFAVTRSQNDANSAGTVTEIATAANGQVQVAIDAHELVTLGPITDYVDEIHYYPRSGYTSRMVGGKFQGSNGNEDNGPWTTLATINTTPVDNKWNYVTLTNTKAYRLLRYLAPSGSYGNVGEVKFYYHNSGHLVTGDPFGTPSVGSNAVDKSYKQVYDQQFATYFDTGTNARSTDPTGNPYAGLDAFRQYGLDNGLKGQYYSDTNFQTLVTTTLDDPSVNFYWGTNAPRNSSGGTDGYSVRWTGQIQAPEPGDYSLRIVADTGATLYLNGSSVASGSDSVTSSIAFKDGEKIPFQYDFSEKNGGVGYAYLEWKRPGETYYEIVPPSQLYPPASP